MTTLGLDLGSRTTKLVLLREGALALVEVFDTSHHPLPRLREVLAAEAPAALIATGYGRHLLAAELGARVVTEIRACARGVSHLYPSARLVLDIGGQDCKVIQLSPTGSVAEFAMNDRCAAGTGRFLEVMAGLLGYDVETFWREACTAPEPVTISSMCTVFAESEVISLLTAGTDRRCIALGLHHSIADRLLAMLPHAPEEGDLVLVGGGALNGCLRDLLSRRVNREWQVPANPQIVSALGAALLAAEKQD